MKLKFKKKTWKVFFRNKIEEVRLQINRLNDFSLDSILAITCVFIWIGPNFGINQFSKITNFKSTGKFLLNFWNF